MTPLIRLAMVGILVLTSCDRAETNSGTSSLPASGRAAVNGVVRFLGTPPPMKVIENRPCHPAAPPLKEETVVVNPDGTLANVFVFIETAGAIDGRDIPAVTLDQVHCRYEPHVIGVVVGQKLVIRSSDPTVHNVHYVPRHNTPANLFMTNAGDSTPVRFTAPEFIRAGCDIHPWMTAWIGVFPNTLFSITDDKGSFTIRDAPPGLHTVVAWHELYGRLEAKVELVDGATATVDFEYKPPSSERRP
jgi:plastocyanin